MDQLRITILPFHLGCDFKNGFLYTYVEVKCDNLSTCIQSTQQLGDPGQCFNFFVATYLLQYILMFLEDYL